MTDQERTALWAKRGEIEAARRVAARIIDKPGPFRDQALARLERLRREYDALYAATA
jgi:hypothetical protein